MGRHVSQPGSPLPPGGQIAYTQPAVDLIQLVGKYMFSGGGKSPDGSDASGAAAPQTGTTP